MRATLSKAGLTVKFVIGFLILIWIGAVVILTGPGDLAGWLAALGSEWLPAPGWTDR